MLEAKNINKIILITIDSLRADHLDELKVINSKNKSWLNFTKAFSAAPYTSASIYSLFTSLYPRRPLYYNRSWRLRGSDIFISLPSILKRKGYITIGLVASNPFLSSITNYDKMFDIFNDYIKDPRAKVRTLGRSIDKILNKLKVDELKKEFIKTYIFNVKPPVINSFDLTTEAINFIKKYKGKRLFLWLHYMDAHVPHIPPVNGLLQKINYALKRLKSLKKKLVEEPSLVGILNYFYRQQINFINYNLSRLFSLLEIEGIIDKTCIIVTSDHGEEFGEHGDYGHKAKLYNELIHVPLVLYTPDIIGREINYIVNLVDITPTILKMLSIKNTPRFLCILDDNYYGKTGTISNAYTASYNLICLNTKDRKYIFYFHNEYRERLIRCEVYNTICDPLEKRGDISNSIFKDASCERIAKVISEYKSARSKLSFIHKPIKLNLHT